MRRDEKVGWTEHAEQGVPNRPYTPIAHRSQPSSDGLDKQPTLTGLGRMVWRVAQTPASFTAIRLLVGLLITLIVIPLL
jgi:hypothetical protein